MPAWRTTFQRVLGRPQRDFADYACEVAASGVWDAQPVRA